MKRPPNSSTALPKGPWRWNGIVRLHYAIPSQSTTGCDGTSPIFSSTTTKMRRRSQALDQRARQRRPKLARKKNMMRTRRLWILVPPAIPRPSASGMKTADTDPREVATGAARRRTMVRPVPGVHRKKHLTLVLEIAVLYLGSFYFCFLVHLRHCMYYYPFVLFF